MKQPSRRQVSLRTADYEKATALQGAITEKSGRKITISDTVARSLECLEDAHARGAWLSPSEAAPVLEQRHRDQVVSVVAQLLARIAPERPLRGVAFDTEHDTLIVHMVDSESFPLVMSGPLMGPDRVADSTH